MLINNYQTFFKNIVFLIVRRNKLIILYGEFEVSSVQFSSAVQFVFASGDRGTNIFEKRLTDMDQNFLCFLEQHNTIKDIFYEIFLEAEGWRDAVHAYDVNCGYLET